MWKPQAQPHVLSAPTGRGSERARAHARARTTRASSCASCVRRLVSHVAITDCGCSRVTNLDRASFNIVVRHHPCLASGRMEQSSSTDCHSTAAVGACHLLLQRPPPSLSLRVWAPEAVLRCCRPARCSWSIRTARWQQRHRSQSQRHLRRSRTHRPRVFHACGVALEPSCLTFPERRCGSGCRTMAAASVAGEPAAVQEQVAAARSLLTRLWTLVLAQ